MNKKKGGTEITPVTKIERALAEVETPEEALEIEAMSAAYKAWAKEQDDFEQAFNANLGYIKSRCLATELIEPEVKRGGDRGENQYSKWQSTKDGALGVYKNYGFTKRQWDRRKQELKAYRKDFDGYHDDCVEKNTLPTITGLVAYHYKIIEDNKEKQIKEWIEQVKLTKEELEAEKAKGARELMVAVIGGYWIDASEGDDYARGFLESMECCDWCDDLGVDYRIIKDWIATSYATTPIHIMLHRAFENSLVKSAARVNPKRFRDPSPPIVTNDISKLGEGWRVDDNGDDPMVDGDDLEQEKAIKEWLEELNSKR